MSACSFIQNPGCSNDWKITGFYTPVENDYEGPEKDIFVKGEGEIYLKKAFLRDVRIEGWGKTRYGWYLGYYGKSWHSNIAALNTSGKPLTVGMVAVDPRIIPLSSRIRIPELSSLLGGEPLIASDVGVSVKKKHIDVYAGEGNKAKKLSYKITGQNSVCFL